MASATIPHPSLVAFDDQSSPVPAHLRDPLLEWLEKHGLPEKSRQRVAIQLAEVGEAEISLPRRTINALQKAFRSAPPLLRRCFRLTTQSEYPGRAIAIKLTL